MKGSRLTKALMAWVVIAGLMACSEAPEPSTHYQENVHSLVYGAANSAPKPQNQQLTEFFWYGCSHCKDFAPVLKQWLTVNSPIKIHYIPIIWSEKTELHAKIFYLIKDRPDFEQLHSNLFDLISGFERTSTLGEQTVALIKQLNEWGIQPIDAADAIQGEQYTAQLAQSLQAIKNYEVKGVPTLVVNNHYKVLNKNLTTTEELLAVAEQLLKR